MKNALSNLKKIFFIEEEYEEVIEEEVVEEVKPVMEPVFQDIRLTQEKVEEPVKEEVVEVVEEPKKSELLTISPSKDKPRTPSKPQVKKPEVTNLNTNKKPDYEFTQVISPIYGLKSTQDQAQPTVKKVSPKKVSALKSPIGTVLSPMYGVYEENPMVQEVEVEPELVDMKVEDFISRKGEPKKAEPRTGVVNLSLFDDEQ